MLQSMILKQPTLDHEDDCREFLEECRQAHSEMAGTAGLERMSYADWLVKITHSQANLNLPEDRVPATTFLAYHHNQLVGIIDIRHFLNDFLAFAGGHIGYMIRPSARRLGWATNMLHQALIYARDTLAIEQVLITCSPENTGSRHTILNNGGIYDGTVEDATLGSVERYWIDLKKDR